VSHARVLEGRPAVHDWEVALFSFSANAARPLRCLHSVPAPDREHGHGKVQMQMQMKMQYMWVLLVQVYPTKGVTSISGVNSASPVSGILPS
jgi:hypothetical protein